MRKLFLFIIGAFLLSAQLDAATLHNLRFTEDSVKWKSDFPKTTYYSASNQEYIAVNNLTIDGILFKGTWGKFETSASVMAQPFRNSNRNSYRRWAFRLNNTNDSYIEFPNVASAGKMTVWCKNGNASNEGSFVIQKLNGTTWQTIKTVYTPPHYEQNYEFQVETYLNIDSSTKLRIMGGTRNIHIYQVRIDSHDGALPKEKPFRVLMVPDSHSLVNRPEWQYMYITLGRYMANESDNVVFVIQQGDITQLNNDAQWKISAAAYVNLEGKNLPLTFVPGNHDLGRHFDVRDASLLNKYMPVSRYSRHSYYGGCYQNSMENSWHTFEQDGYKFLVVSLEYQPRAAVLTWANNIVAARPDYNVIYNTHSYLNNGTSNASRTGPGTTMWNDLVSKHKHSFMVLSGHICDAGDGYRMDAISGGNNVYQIMANYQGGTVTATNTDNCYVRFIDIKPGTGSNGTINIKTYSPQFDRYKTNGGHQRTINNVKLVLPTTALKLTPTLSSSSTAYTLVGNSQIAGSTVHLWVKNTAGEVVDRSNCTYTSSNTTVATIDANGAITTKTAGTTTITATRKTGKAVGTLSLTVTPANLTLNFSSSPTANNSISGTQVVGTPMYVWVNSGIPTSSGCTFTSSNTAVATINNTTGAITTIAAGTTTITATRTSDKITGAITLKVTPPPSLTLHFSSSSTVNTPVSNSQTLGKPIYLWITNETGANVIVSDCSYTNSDNTVATINASTGAITTLKVGSTTITATKKSDTNVKATITLTVTPAPTGGILYVTPDANDDGSGCSWYDPATFANAAEKARTENYLPWEIWVQEGIYDFDATENFDYLFIYGGFKGDETTREQRNWAKYQTIFDGGGAVQILRNSAGNYKTRNPISCLIDGVILQNGNGYNTLPATPAYSNGGAMNVNNGAVIKNCIFRHNETTGTNKGGALHCESGGRIISGDSPTTNPGPGITVVNCLFNNNTANDNGGAIQVGGDALLTIVNSTLLFNVSETGYSGGFGVAGSTTNITMYNVIAWRNRTNAVSGNNGLISYSSNSTQNGGGDVIIVKNCFIQYQSSGANQSKLIGGANAQPGNSNVNLGNGTTESDYFVVSTNLPTGNTLGRQTTTANINRGNEAAMGGFVSTSPYINAGDNAYFLASYGDKDLAGYPRKFNTIDAGAYEYHPEFIVDGAVGTGTRSWADYKSQSDGNIIFRNNGQLTGVSGDGKVSGVVKIEKTFAEGIWYAIGFPFDIDRVSCSKDGAPPYDKNALKTLGPDGPDPDFGGDYRLRAYDGGDDWRSFLDYEPYGAKEIQAGGYLLQVPATFHNVPFTFTSVPRITLSSSAAFASPEPENYTLLSNPSVVNVKVSNNSGIGSGTFFYAFDNPAFNLLQWLTDPYFVKPFESVVVVDGIPYGSLYPSLSTEDTSTSLPAPVKEQPNGKIIATEYYNLQGIKITHPVKGNIYIMKTIFESGKTKAEKVGVMR